LVVIVFRSRLNPGVGKEYGPRAGEMLALAREMPGFLGVKDFAASDGERVALVEFETEAHSRAWGAQVEHRKAQQEGQDKFYAEYSLQICDVVRESRFP
jgi:heme-degrading monooxygenase HmoA